MSLLKGLIPFIASHAGAELSLHSSLVTRYS
jgi:hypothetical protein